MVHALFPDGGSPYPLLIYDEKEKKLRQQGLDLLANRLRSHGLELVCIDAAQNGKTAPGRLLLSKVQENLQYYSWAGNAANFRGNVEQSIGPTDLIVLDRTLAKLLPGIPSIDIDPLCLHAAPDRETERIVIKLKKNFDSRPVWAVVLIGGRSSRMGQPKHLIQDRDGRTWLERTVSLLLPHVARTVLSGGGDIPDVCSDLHRLADIENVSGPLTGIVSAMRWRPDVTWLVLACDMPGNSSAAIDWLLHQRAISHWGVVPRLGRKGFGEPLFALYEPQSRFHFEQMVVDGERRVRMIGEKRRVQLVDVPASLQTGWMNVNTPDELSRCDS